MGTRGRPRNSEKDPITKMVGKCPCHTPLRSALTSQHNHVPQFPLPTTLDSRLTINLVCTEMIKRLGERLFFYSTPSPQIFFELIDGETKFDQLDLLRWGSCANLSKMGECCVAAVISTRMVQYW